MPDRDNEQVKTDVAKFAKGAMTHLTGIAQKGVIAGCAVEQGYAVIVVAPVDDLAIVEAAEGGIETGGDGQRKAAKPAKVKVGKAKGDLSDLLKKATAAATGAAVSSTGLEV